MYREGYRLVAGCDEAGRGPLAGPVVAAAVILPPGWEHADIRDSKKLTPRKRAALFSIIDRYALAWNWAAVDADQIDRINILQASLLAMRQAVERLAAPPEYLIVDGNQPVPTSLPQTSIPGGDGCSQSIGAASIMAKVVRDTIMARFDRLYPRYNFAAHKGYGTREHLAALARYGHCPAHRKSFRGVPAHMAGRL